MLISGETIFGKTTARMAFFISLQKGLNRLITCSKGHAKSGFFKSHAKDPSAMLPESEILKYANLYKSFGWSVLPVKKGEKHPALHTWTQYQDERASDEQLEEWFVTIGREALGMATGALSGVVVVDTDAQADEAFLSLLKAIDTPTAQSGSGIGYHFFFAHPGYHIPNAMGFRHKIDFRGDGGFIMLAPSPHPSGGTYRWIKDPMSTPLTPLPDFVLQALNAKNNESKEPIDWPKLLTGAGEGSRHISATQLIGKLQYHLPVELWGIIVPYMTDVWNARNTKKYDHKHFQKIFDDFAKKNVTKIQAQESFEVTAIKKIRDLLIIDTTFGQARMHTKDFITQRTFNEKLFECTSRLLPAFPKDGWQEKLSQWSLLITEDTEDAEVTLLDVIEEALDDIVATSQEGALGFLRKGVPIKQKDGVLFKLSTLYTILSQEKGLTFTRPELIAVLKQVGCETKRPTPAIRAWWYPHDFEEDLAPMSLPEEDYDTTSVIVEEPHNHNLFNQ